MKINAIICLASIILAAALCLTNARLRTDPSAALAFTFITFGWVYLMILGCSLAHDCLFVRRKTDHITEPDTDPAFLDSPNLGPVLVEGGTAADPSPPADVQVYEYRWNQALGAYDLARVIPLSQYNLEHADPEAEQVLSRTPLPTVWEHSKVADALSPQAGRPRSPLPSAGDVF